MRKNRLLHQRRNLAELRPHHSKLCRVLRRNPINQPLRRLVPIRDINRLPPKHHPSNRIQPLKLKIVIRVPTRIPKHLLVNLGENNDRRPRIKRVSTLRNPPRLPPNPTLLKYNDIVPFQSRVNRRAQSPQPRTDNHHRFFHQPSSLRYKTP